MATDRLDVNGEVRPQLESKSFLCAAEELWHHRDDDRGGRPSACPPTFRLVDPP